MIYVYKRLLRKRHAQVSSDRTWTLMLQSHHRTNICMSAAFWMCILQQKRRQGCLTHDDPSPIGSDGS